MKRIIIFAILSTINLSAQLCFDFQIWDGSEKVKQYGIDSTGNWWIITEPFSNFNRLIVNGEQLDEFHQISPPIFSRNGKRWATFGEYQGSWYLITEKDIIELKATSPGNLVFTNNSNFLTYSYFIANLEYIILPDKTIEVYGKQGSFYVNQDATKFAFKGMRGTKFVLNINGKESDTFEEIIPIGFWKDDGFVYAARNGFNWQVYKNFAPITRTYSNIKEPLINPEGSVLAFIATTFSNHQIAVTIADEFFEPLESRQYDLVSYLSLHPELPIVTFFAKKDNFPLICVNTAEYSTTNETSPPYFSSDGNDIYFIGCDFACFVSINGIRYNLKHNLAPQTKLAIKPNSKTIAFSSSCSMNLLFLETSRMHSGMMVDRILAPIYNSKTKRYETIGQIGNRLYLLTCRTE
ncbi:MAG TPA: hypothetical protein PL149_03240 [Candidatus Kapabacteria bacterium]|jgi:hypothetical protein|nr:hypothetical protein [Candidatus Kapabacteria bacterium]